jgi:hypothetical protein
MKSYFDFGKRISIDIHMQSWALQRGYLTAKAARPDAYRAANSILRFAGKHISASCHKNYDDYDFMNMI